jgi:hypothetical protein
MQACSHPDMNITISQELKIETLPSGSGITKFGETYYIVGDDSPFLFSLNSDFKIISKTPLLDTVNFPGERISKVLKPDFETLERIGNKELVVFGSGSKSPQRNIFLRLLLTDRLIIEKYDISDLYENLKNLPALKDTELNIEATAFHNHQIFLFNRKKNLIIRFEYKELLAFIKDEAPFPTPEIRSYTFPQIQGMEAGFSGATAMVGESKIIFTTSVENTDNAYDDGEIIGSLIGIIDISNYSLSGSYSYCQIPNATTNLKVESVTVEEEVSSSKARVVLIADDDKGNSTLLRGLLQW